MDENTIFKAAYENDIDTLKQAFEVGFSIQTPHPRSGHTPLQAACETNATKAIKLLLELGADPNGRFTKVSRVDGHVICNNSVPLLEVRSVEAAKILLENGADIKLTDGNGLSASDWATKRKLGELSLYLNSRNEEA